MALRIGAVAPDFKAETTAGTVKFHEWTINSWVILFSHPKDFSPGSMAELGDISKMIPEFKKRDVKILAISLDHLYFLKQWDSDTIQSQNIQINFPLIADPDRRVAVLYDLIHPNAAKDSMQNAVYIIAPNRKIKNIFVYPKGSARNFSDILTSLDFLQQPIFTTV